MLFIWLYSTFMFFMKNYKFSKYISMTRRFWRRSFNLFWLVESLWFIIFIYCLLTANHEPVHYEEVYIYKNFYIGSFKIYFINNLLVVALILFVFTIIIFIKFISFFQFIQYFLLINIFFLFFFFIELYQFCNVVSFFWELSFIFNNINNFFELFIDYWRFRPRVAFFSVMLLAKFWHFIFILGCWVIFLIKIVENKLFSLELLSASLQNLIIFYLMSFIHVITLCKWFFKFIFKKLWFWFFINPINNIFYISFFNYFVIFFFNYIYRFYKYLTIPFSYFNKINFFYYPTISLFDNVNYSFNFVVGNFLIYNF